MFDAADRNVLIIEDDPDASANISDILELDGFICDAVGGIADALQRLSECRYGFIILDRSLPDGNSITHVPQMRKLAPDLTIVVVTAYADLDGAIQALRCGASDYILKPINPDVLRTTLSRAADAKATAAEIDRLNRDLNRRESELETLLNVFPSELAIAITDDPLCQHIHVSHSFSTMLGLPWETDASSCPSVTEWARFHYTASGAKVPAAEMPLQQSAWQGREVQGLELDAVRSDGEIVHLLCYSNPLYDEGGNPRGAVGAFLNVTERRKSALALEQSEQRFHAIFANTTDGLVVLDQTACIVDANPAALEIFGRSLPDIAKVQLRELLSNKARRAFLPHWHSLLESGTARGEFQRVHRDGRTIHLEFRAVANFLPGLHVVSLRDVTERQRAEQRLLQSERLAAIGETFTGLAHESRNALQRSRACLELLSLEVEQQPDAVVLVERVLHAQDRLEELYEEVQNYAAPINLKYRALDIREVWRSAWKESIDTSLNRTVVLIEQSERADFQCDVDSDRMRLVFLNIFRNAQEVSPPHGHVRLRCSGGSVGNQAAICISISDNGPGMSLEQRERIFDPFYTTKMQGTGLGMAISKRIIQAHGGRICVTEKDGPGTEVVILLPLLRTPDPSGTLQIYQ